MVNKIIAACPKCSNLRTKVVCTKRSTDSITIRRRFCSRCEHRWYTIQYPEVAVNKGEVKWIKSGSEAEYAYFAPTNSA